ncbi:hypothetical protein XENOCAPTIV_019486 [Xenoophorus captivus]|uniref:Uncharacterized protein n=1 Tax=Xenoophorus captivus TaxID=1517983 RepID=A0ABV0S1W6_9TELE
MQAICLACPHSHTDVDTRHTNVLERKRGAEFCLSKAELNFKFAYTVTPFLYFNKGMLAPMLLQFYNREVRANFWCLILQLIANRMSIALQHTATSRQPEHSVERGKHKHHSL